MTKREVGEFIIAGVFVVVFVSLLTLGACIAQYEAAECRQSLVGQVVYELFK